MKRWMCLAVLFVGAWFFFSVQRCVAAPALWVVQTPAGKVDLFGAVHIINDNVHWRSAELDDSAWGFRPARASETAFSQRALVSYVFKSAL